MNKTEEYKRRIFELVGNEYEVIGEYMGYRKKVLMKHTPCGHTYSITPANFIFNESRCPECFWTKRKKKIS